MIYRTISYIDKFLLPCIFLYYIYSLDDDDNEND